MNSKTAYEIARLATREYRLRCKVMQLAALVDAGEEPNETYERADDLHNAAREHLDKYLSDYYESQTENA